MAEIFPWPYNNPRRVFESQLTRPSFPLVSKLAMGEQPRSQRFSPTRYMWVMWELFQVLTNRKQK